MDKTIGNIQHMARKFLRMFSHFLHQRNRTIRGPHSCLLINRRMSTTTATPVRVDKQRQPSKNFITHTLMKIKRVIKRPKIPNLKRSEEHTSELQSRGHLVCRLLLEKKKQSD